MAPRVEFVASAGWIDSSRSPIQGTGLLYPNSRVSMADIGDGTGTTLMVGERSRNLADATWSGVFGSRSVPGPLCTKRAWPVQSCVAMMFLLMGRSGPSSDIVSGSIPGGNPPNAPGAGADGFASLHPGGCQFLLGDGSVRFIKQTVAPPVFQALADPSRWRGARGRPVLRPAAPSPGRCMRLTVGYSMERDFMKKVLEAPFSQHSS